MEVFQFRENLTAEYSRYVQSFIQISDPAISSFVNDKFAEGKLWPDPLVQLNPSFAPGEWIDELVSSGLLHEKCSRIFRRDKSPTDPEGKALRLHLHQQQAIELARQGKNYVLTTGTGSGKSLSYIIPIVDRVLRANSGPGIKAIVVYPMNALANSQMGELQKFLDHGFDGIRPVKFDRYTGQEKFESRRRIQQTPPDILLTNYVMLELILTRPEEAGLVDAFRDLQFLVLDELHTYRGRQGADVSMLLRRLRSVAGASDMQFVGTSATLAGPGTWRQQQEEVAELASRIFGRPLAPECIVGETLRRSSLETDFTDSQTVTALESIVRNSASRDWTTFESFRNDPLVAWVEETFGIRKEEGTGRLVRSNPLPIKGANGAAGHLSRLTNCELGQCEQALQEVLLTGATKIRHPQTDFPLFAFRLHQFISRGDTVYSSLENGLDRVLMLDGQRFAPGDRKRLIYPLSFCRECGHEFFSVYLTKDPETGKESLVAREPNNHNAEEGQEPGFYYLDRDRPWPDISDKQAVIQRLPADWLETAKGSGFTIAKSRQDRVPRRMRCDLEGNVGSGPIEGAYFPAPFIFCPHCEVSYDPRQRSDYSKLTTLGSEGRSTATTILATGAITKLRESAELQEQAKKLLSFTDNRQDASLQSGHLNDFVEVGLLRCALYKAAAEAGEEGLRHDVIARRVVESMGLPVENYAADPSVRYEGRRRVDRAFHDMVGYLLFRDLRRGWRINAPNLEQCGLLQIDYGSLDELCATNEDWTDAHPLLRNATPDQRKDVCRILLDAVRRDLGIASDYLSEEFHESIKQRSNELSESWRFEMSESLDRSRAAFPCSRPNQKIPGIFISARGAFGTYLRVAGRLSESRMDIADAEKVLESLFEQLTIPSILQKVSDPSREVSVPGYLINPGSLIWRAGDGTLPFRDPVRIPNPPKLSGKPNDYFIDFYRHRLELLKNIRSREHTAQVPAELREKREEAFGEATLPILFCSPTMELGIDIRQLNVVNMRNVPPTPANYAQRSGRAGRGGQPAFVFTYCSFGSPHDQYFFRRQDRMVSGRVSSPRIDLTNEDLIRSHIHALWLGESRLDLRHTPADLVELSGDSPSLDLKPEVVAKLDDPSAKERTITLAEKLLRQLEEELHDVSWFDDRWIEEVIERIPLSFEESLERWRDLYRSAMSQAQAQDGIIRDHSVAQAVRKNAEQLRREAEQQLTLLSSSSSSFQSDFYSYRYFASEGFLPGYNFPRLPLSAFIPGRRSSDDREDFLSRPRFLAISEFGPGALIYHEGSRYQVTRVMMPVGSDHELQTSSVKICTSCGYLHPIENQTPPDLCQRCAEPLDQILFDLFRMQNVRTQRRQRISCDEEERLRLGYEIKTGVRFSMRAGRRKTFKGTVHTPDRSLLELEYGDTATIWRINYGWSRRKKREELGFWLDLEKRQWTSSSQEPDSDEPALGNQPTIRRVIPFVQDRRNVLILKPVVAYPQEFMASLQAALKSAIQVVFQLEDVELALEPLPDRKVRRELLIYEASEGGAGVLRQLISEPHLIQEVARAALEICHFDPDTGEDQGGAPHASEQCEAACYDCLRSYYNQPDHDLLDRKYIRDFLCELAQAETTVTAEPPAHSTAHLPAPLREWLDFLAQYELSPPDQVQPQLTQLGVQPDFLFEDEAMPAVVYLEEVAAGRDASKETDLRSAGLTIIRFGPRDSWLDTIARYPSLFGRSRETSHIAILAILVTPDNRRFRPRSFRAGPCPVTGGTRPAARRPDSIRTRYLRPEWHHRHHPRINSAGRCDPLSHRRRSRSFRRLGFTGRNDPDRPRRPGARSRCRPQPLPAKQMKTQVSEAVNLAMRHFDAATAGLIWKCMEQYKENPAHPSLKLERLNKAKDKKVWSIRVGRDVRMIIHKDGDLTTFLYVDHHDAAYHWAETHYVKTHGTTQAMQVVEVVEVVEKVVRKEFVQPTATPIFASHTPDYLLTLGIPEEYLPLIRNEIRSDEQLLKVVERLPAEVGNRLLRLADGETVIPPVVSDQTAPEDHPDARAQFHPITEDTQLQKLLLAPFDTWLVFLHPSQHRAAYGDFKGPVKATGTAGTGKTVAALHRAYHLASQGEEVFLCTYVKILAENLKRCADLLCGSHPEIRARIHISTVHAEAHAIMKPLASLRVVSDDEVRTLISKSPTRRLCTFSDDAIFSEWKHVFEAQGIQSWDAYRSASRVGLGKPLQIDARKQIWQVLESVIAKLGAKSCTWAFLAGKAATAIKDGKASSRFSAVVVDEVQDLGIQEIQFLHALAPEKATFLGDSGQRIYSRAFSFQALGIEVRGRSFQLKINYRTTSEIRRFADRLQAKSTDDMAGEKESRTRVISLLTGNEPVVQSFPDRKTEIDFVADEIARHIANHESAETIAIIARSQDLLKGYSGALDKGRGIPVTWLKNNQGSVPGAINLCTMHGGKGLEFRIVYVVDVNAHNLPHPKSLEGIEDPVLLQEARERERNLLYVSCTRARDFLTVTSAGQPSPFLDPVQ